MTEGRRDEASDRRVEVTGRRRDDKRDRRVEVTGGTRRDEERYRRDKASDRMEEGRGE